MSERAQNPYDLRAADAVRGGRDTLVEEIVAHLLRGRSVLALAASGMDAPGLLRRAIARVVEMRDDVVVLRPGLTPVADWADRVLEIAGLLVRAARERAAGDAIWDGLAADWDAERPAFGEAGGLPAAFGRLATMLREVAEASGLVVLVVDDLDAWLPADAGEPAERRALEAGLRTLLTSATPPALRLLAAGPPDLARPRATGWPGVIAAVERVPVEPLTFDDVATLLAREAPALEEDDVVWIHRMLGGHPQLVRALGHVLARWRVRRGPLDDTTRLSLTATVDDAVRSVVEEAIATLRRLDAGPLVDRLFQVAVTAEPAAFTPGELVALWPLGIVDDGDRIPERLRAVVARGAVIARGAGRANAPAEIEDEDERAVDGDDANVEDDPLGEMGRKERLLYNYLRERAGEPVHWKELAAAYFVGDPETLQDDEKALRSLRATVNRINARVAPSEAASRGGWKLVRWARDARGFFVDRAALATLGH